MVDDAKKLGVSGAGSIKVGGRVTIQARRRNARLANPTPDNPAQDITGAWEEDGSLSVRVNQAGNHIEGWLVDYVTKRLTLIGGDLSANTFRVYTSPSGDPELGTIQPDGSGNLIFNSKLRSSPFILRRTDKSVGLSDNAVKAFPPKLQQPILDDQRRPLSAGDKFTIRSACNSFKLGPLIDEFHNLPTPTNTVEKFTRAKVVEKIEVHFRALFAKLNVADHAAAARHAQLHLRTSPHQVGDRKQSLMNWLQAMAPVAEVLSNDPIPTMTKHLGITVAQAEHHYSLSIVTVGVGDDVIDIIKKGVKGISVRPGLGVGYFDGTCEIKETSEADGKGKTLNTFKYPIRLFNVGLGVGFAVGGTMSGKFTTRFHWKEDDFRGMIKICDASIGIIGQVGITGIFISGSGTFPELAIDGSGTDWVFGASAGISEYFGFIGGESKQAFEIPKTTQYEGTAQAEQAIHFRFGFADLQPEARQLVRIFAAQELAILRSGGAKLFLVGNADSVDTVEYNELLSEMRAFNTDQALKDILGANYKPKEKKMIGLGESVAQQFDPPETPNPVRRRVDITINGRLVMQLRGEQR